MCNGLYLGADEGVWRGGWYTRHTATKCESGLRSMVLAGGVGIELRTLGSLPRNGEQAGTLRRDGWG